uniref:Amine oxidase domain-containing protein n=1 Tax=Aplanochytrium stocchinoi TaxID=215587 RepID=A0A7S3UZ95_9STRA
MVQDEENECEILPTFHSFYRRLYAAAAKQAKTDKLNKVFEKVMTESSFCKLSPRIQCILRWIFACHELWLGLTFDDIDCEEWVEMANPDNPSWGDLDGPHAIITEGIGRIVETRMTKKLETKINHRVIKIEQTNQGCRTTSVASQSDKGDTSATITSAFVIVTIPVAVLAKSADDLFSPSLSNSMKKSLSEISISHYLKVYLVFNRVFWDKESTWIGVTADFPNKDPSNQPFMLYFNYYKFNKAPILIATACGEAAKLLEMKKEDNEIVKRALKPLYKVFGTHIEEWLEQSLVTRWGKEKYSKGAYPLGSFSIDQEHGSVLFAGDGITANGDEGSLHAACFSGIKQAETVLEILQTRNAPLQ